MNNAVRLVSTVLAVSSLVFAQMANVKAPAPNTEFAYWNPEKGQWLEDPDARVLTE